MLWCLLSRCLVVTEPVIIGDCGGQVLELSVHIVHVVHAVPHGAVVEQGGPVRLVVALMVVVPPAPGLTVVATSSALIETIAPAIMLTSPMMLTITSSSTLLSLSTQSRGRSSGLSFVNTRLVVHNYTSLITNWSSPFWAAPPGPPSLRRSSPLLLFPRWSHSGRPRPGHDM